MNENNNNIKEQRKKIDLERWMYNLSTSKDKGKLVFMFACILCLGLYVYHLMGVA